MDALIFKIIILIFCLGGTIGFWKYYQTPQKLTLYQKLILAITFLIVFLILYRGLAFTVFCVVLAPPVVPIILYLTLRFSAGLMFLATRPHALRFRVDLLFLGVFIFLPQKPLALWVLLAGVILEAVFVSYYKKKHPQPKSDKTVLKKSESLPQPNTTPATLPGSKNTPSITLLLDSILSGKAEQVQAALAQDPSHLNTPYADNGNTPLHVAAWNGYKDIVELLLAQPGIDTQAKNLAGKTALDLAQEKNFTDIIELLKFTEQK